MKPYDLMWIGWILSGIIVEILAIRADNKARREGKEPQGRPLSNHLWKWFGIKGNGRNGIPGFVKRQTIIGFLAWLFLHIILGGVV